jgi:hypothetical protein
MAKKIDPSSLTIDYKQLMRMPLSQRLEIMNSGFANDVLRDITPTQLAQAFPRYYQRAMPDIGKIVSAGGSAAAAGLPGVTGGAGRPSAGPTATPAPVAPSGRQNPQASQQIRQDSFLAGLRELRQQQKTQQEVSQPQGRTGPIDRSRFASELGDPATKRLFAQMIQAEVGSQGELAQKKFAETVFNRAIYEGKSLKQILSSTAYYHPYRNGRFETAGRELNDDILRRNNSVIDHVFKGSDYTKGASHNFYSRSITDEELIKKYNAIPGTIIRHGGEVSYRKTWEDNARLPRYVESSTAGATQPLKPDQERPSQSSAATGLTPDSKGPRGAKSEEELIKQGKNVRGFTYGDSERGGGECVKGSQGVLGALLGDSKKFSQQIGHRAAGSMTLEGGNNYLSKTGYFTSPSAMSSDYLKDPTQWRIGDTIVAQGGARGLGHIQVWNGKAWVSDFKQSSGILMSSKGIAYTGHTIYRLNNDALSRIHPDYLKQMDGNRATSSYMSSNNINPGQAPIVGTDKEATPFSTQQTTPTPSNYDSWPKPLRDYLEKNPDAKKEFLEAHAEGVNVLDYYNQQYSKDPKFFEQNPEATASVVAKVATAPPGEAPRLDQELSYGFWKEGSVPTPEERKKVFEKGGVVVNLDTNWAKRGVQTGPLVVIPDNATDEQRKQAQIYVRQIEEAYKEKFGKSLPGKVLTRSENKRGRESTMHTEPFSVNDEKAVEYFTRTPEGRAKLAEITSNTIGKIPGVQFSLPHDPYKPQRPDYGAVGPLGSEVDIASVLKRDLEEKQRVQREQIQSKQIAPVVAEPTAVPVSSDQYNANATNAQQPSAPSSQADQKAGTPPIVPPGPQVAPGTQPTIIQNNTTVVNPVSSELQPPSETPDQMAYGDTGRLPPTGREPIQLVNKGKVLADVSPGEMIKAPSFGTNKPEVIPETRIRDIRAEQQNNPQIMDQPEQPMQQPQNVAGMTSGATQMPPPNMYNDTNKVYQPYMESAGKIDTISNAKAYAYAGFKELISDNHSSGVNRMNTGFNTLTA